uniref:ATP-dependent DNA helicase n=1 Tax=Octopus bimaculoides TaxID=37653 RepID=A0A0L8HQP0_OCTBM
MSPTHSDTTYKFKQMQFPIKLCFPMTINKAQGQSVQAVGLNLTEQVFSHAQLYVGCPHGLSICAPEGRTKNVVYQEALQ